MKLSLTRQESLAQDPLRFLERPPLHERALIGDEHLVDQVGAVQQDLVVGAEPEAADIAVLVSDIDESPDGVAPEAVGETTGNVRPGARRETRSTCGVRACIRPL